MDRSAIQGWIQQNELQQAIEALIAHARGAGLRDWERELIDLVRRFKENGDRYRKNLITAEEWSVNESRIANTLLDMLDHLEEGTPGPTAAERQALQEALPEAPRSRFRTFAGALLATTLALALVFVWFFWEMGGMPNAELFRTSLTLLSTTAVAGLISMQRFRKASKSLGSAPTIAGTPLHVFLFILVLAIYLFGIFFFLYQKAVGGLFGESFTSMRTAIGVWCLLFGLFGGYWVKRLFV